MLKKRTVLKLVLLIFILFIGCNELSSLRRKLKIQIVTIVEADTDAVMYYKQAIESVACYAKIHGYENILVYDDIYKKECPNKDRFFRRHCIVSDLLENADYTLFIDADIGVINPKRRIEDFIDGRFDISFYERFYNQEVAAGSYIVSNSEWSKAFLRGFSNYEFKLPKGVHGSDNGALHAYLLSVLFPSRSADFSICLAVWTLASTLEELFSFVACARAVMGISEEFENIRIFKKGSAWVRDGSLSNSGWSPSRDFMIHGWKQMMQLQYEGARPPGIPKFEGAWYDPFSGPFDMKLCRPGNLTWHYDRNLIISASTLDLKLKKLHKNIENGRWKRLAMIPEILKM